MLEPIPDAIPAVATTLDAFVPLQSDEGSLEDWQVMAIAAAMCLLAGVGVLRMGADQYGKSRIVKNTGTEKIRSMAVGRTELNGTARAYDQTYAQPFRKGECVFGTYSVQELVTKQDGDEEKKEWKTITSGTIGDRIVLEDETGAVIMERPSMTYSGELETRTKQGNLANLFEETFLADWFGLGPNKQTVAFLEENGIAVSSSNRRKYVQKVVPPETDLYVLGQAVRRDDDADAGLIETLHEKYDGFTDTLVIERDDGSGEYIVTDKSEDKMARDQFLKAVAAIGGGIVFMALGAGLLGLSLQGYGLI